MEIGTAFLLGLMGSLHCAGMCGPLALALPGTGRSSAGFLGGRVAYNAGRILTYCVLGLVFGAMGHTLALAGFQRWLSICLGAVLLIGLFGARRFALRQPLTTLVQGLKGRMSVLLGRRSFLSSGVLGLLNGLLPCGLVYVACAGATATGGILEGGRYMVVFGAGTVPMMLAIGLSGRLIPISLRLRLAKAIPVSVFVLGCLLILRGMSLGIPFVSPDLAGGASCCHR
jgi:sulfite exporter TauE/SafE